MDSFLIDTDRLPAVMLRLAPIRRRNRQGEAIDGADDNGQPLLYGEAIVPGVAASSFAPPTPRQVRVRWAGDLPAGVVDNAVVRFTGRTTITGWYQRGRGATAPARSMATITPEGIEVAHGQTPAFSGLLPIRMLEPDPLTLMYAEPKDGAYFAHLIVPTSIRDDEGTVTVRLDANPGDDLAGRLVHLEDPTVKVIQPDREDIGRSAKVTLELHATRVVPVETVAAGARARRPEPVPTENGDHSEG